MSSSAQTFPQTLARALGTNPGAPFVTFYDDESGERQELSTTTYANWVAKASSLLIDEHGMERGDSIRIDLPTHWLATVFLGAAWNSGLVVTDDDGSDSSGPDAVVCGPETLSAWADDAGKRLTLACSLLPFGVRFADPLPQDVHDVGIEVWGQPDAFTPFDPPAPDDAATSWGGVETTHAALFGSPEATRLLSTISPASPAGAEILASLLAGGGSLVAVTHASDDRVAALAETERAQVAG